MNRAILKLLALLVLVRTVQAQSSGDLNEGTRITTGSSSGAYNFSWWGQPGRTYFIQQSDDLFTWNYLPVIESGDNNDIAWGFTSTASKFFFRLRYSDILTSDPFTADFDGDKVSNWDELLQGTDPLLAMDTDGSGLPDDWQKFYFGHTGVDPNALAPGGGGMTNLQHFQLGSNPNDAPPLPKIILRASIPDLDSSQSLNASGQLLTNGDFSSPSVGAETWKLTSGIVGVNSRGWTAISGELVEIQNFSGTAINGQYCELDSHWTEGKPETEPSDHGIQQDVSLARRLYSLTFDYRGRRAGADSIVVKLKNAGSTAETLFTKNSASSTEWKRAFVLFEITGGNPNDTNLPFMLQFDIPETELKDSYGAFIDNVILLPIEVRDIKDHANTGDDVTISNWTTGQEITDANIAWIEAHNSATDAAPRMPQLEFNVPGLPQNVTLEAKLLVEYERPYAGKQTDDTVRVPDNGSFQSVTNGRWQIWNDYANIPFFGGDATLTYKINGGAEQTIKFAIGGRNPDDARCKTYTQGRPNAPWYAYAIEKHESQAYNPGFYNQFWERSGNSSPINNGVNYTFTRGDALVVRSPGETGVGGTGLAQVTGAGGNKTVSAPREIFWHWQRNVDALMVILAGKIQLAETFMNDPAPRNGPGSMPNGQRPQTTFHTGNNVPVPSRVQGRVTFGDAQGNKRPEDAVAIKAYNGASSHWCSWRGPTVHEWQFNYGQNNYVEQVGNQVEEAQP